MKGSQTAIIGSKGAFLCFDVDCDADLNSTVKWSAKTVIFSMSSFGMIASWSPST
ncbi:hypothetical protein SAMN04487889_1395 [Eubacterium pyruvativorans]|nr:hypothetical protein SAMN04487889_1395 [Eubacterium pyruvativorans]